MDSDNLFEPHLFWFQLVGLKLMYAGSWKDKLQKYISFGLVLNIIISTQMMLFYIIFTEKNLEEFVEAIAPFSSCIDSILKFISFCWFQKDLRNLIFDLKKLSSEFDEESCEEFRKLIERSRLYFNILSKLSVITGFGLFLKNIFIIMFEKRELPFKSE
jgi:hypothetical protein